MSDNIPTCRDGTVAKIPDDAALLVSSANPETALSRIKEYLDEPSRCLLKWRIAAHGSKLKRVTFALYRADRSRHLRRTIAYAGHRNRLPRNALECDSLGAATSKPKESGRERVLKRLCGSSVVLPKLAKLISAHGVQSRGSAANSSPEMAWKPKLPGLWFRLRAVRPEHMIRLVQWKWAVFGR